MTVACAGARWQAACRQRLLSFHAGEADFLEDVLSRSQQGRKALADKKSIDFDHLKIAQISFTDSADPQQAAWKALPGTQAPGHSDSPPALPRRQSFPASLRSSLRTSSMSPTDVNLVELAAVPHCESDAGNPPSPSGQHRHSSPLSHAQNEAAARSMHPNLSHHQSPASQLGVTTEGDMDDLPSRRRPSTSIGQARHWSPPPPARHPTPTAGGSVAAGGGMAAPYPSGLRVTMSGSVRGTVDTWPAAAVRKKPPAAFCGRFDVPNRGYLAGPAGVTRMLAMTASATGLSPTARAPPGPGPGPGGGSVAAAGPHGGGAGPLGVVDASLPERSQGSTPAEMLRIEARMEAEFRRRRCSLDSWTQVVCCRRACALKHPLTQCPSRTPARPHARTARDARAQPQERWDVASASCGR